MFGLERLIESELAENESGEPIESAPTPPLALVERMELSVEEITAFVVEATAAKRLPAGKAVEEAYGSCEEATVEDEKNTPGVQIEEEVAEVEVAKLFAGVNGYTPPPEPV